MDNFEISKNIGDNKNTILYHLLNTNLSLAKVLSENIESLPESELPRAIELAATGKEQELFQLINRYQRGYRLYNDIDDTDWFFMTGKRKKDDEDCREAAACACPSM